MMNAKIQSTMGMPKIVSDDLYIVYDKSSGDVLHVHRVTNLKGAPLVTEKQVQAKLTGYFEQFHIAADKKTLGFLKAKPSQLKPNVDIRVDVKKNKLVNVKRIDKDTSA